MTEAYAPGVASDGTGLLLFVPKGGIADINAPSEAELTAVSVKKLTYSLIPGGFNHTTTENPVTSGRWTARQVIELPGTIQDSVELTYVTTQTNNDIARTVLAEGTEGYLVVREAIPNGTPIQDGQLVTVIPGRAGVQRTVPPTENTEWQKIQRWYVTDEVARDKPVGGSGS